MRLIGLSGLKTSGKDSTCAVIQTVKPNLNVKRVSFADRLKVLAGKSIGCEGSDQEIIDEMNSAKETAPYEFEVSCAHISLDPLWVFNARQYLQWLGAAGRDVFGEEFWVNIILPNPEYVQPWLYPPKNHVWNNKYLNNMYPNVDILVVTDVRYPNEARRILDLGGEVWEIVRPGTESDGHSSETPLPREYITQIINNHGSLVDLYNEVKESLA